jgi:cysteine desulfurase
MNAAMRLGNSSASYATTAKDILKTTEKEILNWVRSPKYKVIFTSCGSESINTIINGLLTSRDPHIITTNAEHKTTLDCCKYLTSKHMATVSYVPVNNECIVSPHDIVKNIRPNTVLVSIIHGNNETGSINNVYTIASAVKAINKNIVVHIDAVQTFGKMSIGMADNSIDAMSISAHKLNAPIGVGCLIVCDKLMKLLNPLICGSQNYNKRGGTENIPAINGLKAAIIDLSYNRERKNDEMYNKVQYIYDYLQKNKPDNFNIIKITPEEPHKALPNTLMIAIANRVDNFCNVKFKQLLLEHKVIVSIGSVCNTGSKSSSHILDAISLENKYRKGVIRISVSDYTSWSDCKTMSNIFVKCLAMNKAIL